MKTSQYVVLLSSLVMGTLGQQARAADPFSFKALTKLWAESTLQQASDVKSCHRKPGADIALSSSEFITLNPGEIRDLTLDFTAAATSGRVSIRLEPDKGVRLLSTPIQFEFDLSETPSLSVPVAIQAPMAGSWLLNVFATITDAQGQSSSRAMALVVRAGNAMVSGGEQKGQSPLPGDMAAVVVMPAQETIR